ncbi:MAG TPA: hypothetical protein VFA08_02580 [Actinomycetota bacterium]|jgi:hypothetical protein|nr:hypothetical protein [Actinomycetota bacterium]
MNTLTRGLVVALLLAAACTSNDPPAPGGESPVSPSIDEPSPQEVPPSSGGRDSAPAALERLCTLPQPKFNQGNGAPAEGPTPPAIADVMRQLEQIRGFEFSERVVAEPKPPAEVAQGIRDYVETTFPRRFYDRRSLAWQTIGVIPEGTSIREDLLEYVSTQVIGYYDTITGELVFIGTSDPSPLERVTLAHELTHAIDDQRFGLEQVDLLGAECRDEELQAALAVVEGNATFFMLRWGQSFLSVEEQLELSAEAAAQQPPPSTVAPFIDAIQQWPYLDGLRFITHVETAGGLDAVDSVFRELPVSTEQIIHPERYPDDVPTSVDVPDIFGAIGGGWNDLDVQSVGEMWLDLALSLRIDDADAADAAAGWDGGIYRAWSHGRDVAVILSTEWDTPEDADEFATAMERWIAEGDQIAEVLPIDGTSVRVAFATSDEILGNLIGAA